MNAPRWTKPEVHISIPLVTVLRDLSHKYINHTKKELLCTNVSETQFLNELKTSTDDSIK